MRKINAEKFVCTPDQVIALMALGILPAGYFCYEMIEGQYEFAGEYFDQEQVIPAWTIEELNVLLGGDFEKPNLLGKPEWRRSVNMLQYIIYFPEKMKYYPNGAEAYAAYLEYLLEKKLIKAKDCNDRMDAFVNGKSYNPLSEKIEKL